MGFPLTSSWGLSKLLVCIFSIAIAVLRDGFRSLIIECDEEGYDDAQEQEQHDQVVEWILLPQMDPFYASIARRYLREDEEQGGEEEVEESSLETLPSHCFGGDASCGGHLQCVVCLCEFQDTQVVRELPGCNHVFHKDCIDAWLLGSHCTCPLCRAPLPAMVHNSQAHR